jgi:excisionase family DNA binding protein
MSRKRTVAEQKEYPAVMTAAEAAAYLRISKQILYRLVRSGNLPGFKVGGDWRFHLDDVDRWRLTQNATGSK